MYPELISRCTRQLPAWVALALGTFAFAPSLAFAEWTGGLEGGAVIRDGVTSNRLRLSLQSDDRPLNHYIYADWIRTGGDDSYEAGYRPRYWFSPQLYTFGELTYRTDKPIGIDRETTQAAGVGYQLLQSDSQSAFVEFGGGARQRIFTDVLLEDLSEPFARARAGYVQKLGDVARFELDAAATNSADITETNAEVGLVLRLGGVAIKASYRVIELRVANQQTISDDTTSLTFSYDLQ